MTMRPKTPNWLSISQVARHFGVRASALRYYEDVGILPPALRIGGQRRYDRSDLRRLAVIQRARQVGFTLEEIALLFSGFDKDTPASQRWQGMANKKLSELAAAAASIVTMQTLLKSMSHCGCEALDECGESFLDKRCGNCDAPPPRAANKSPARELKKLSAAGRAR